MPRWNQLSWSSALSRSGARNPSPSIPIWSGVRNGARPAQQVFAVGGMVDPQIIGTLTRVDGEVGEELFAGDPGEIIEFIDQVLELLVSLHDQGLTHGNLIEEYVMRGVIASASGVGPPRVKYYLVGFREGLGLPYGQATTNTQHLARGFDVGCIGGIFERMLYMKFPDARFLHPLIKAMKDRKPARRPSAREAQCMWLKIKAERFS